MSDILRGIITLFILAIISVFIISIVVDKRNFTEQLTTVFVFAVLLIYFNLDSILKRSQNNPLCVCLLFTVLFIIELAGVIAVAINDTGDTIILKVWFQIDVLICVITFVAVLYHIMLICGGTKGGKNNRRQAPNDDDFVAINVHRKRVPLPQRAGTRVPPKVYAGMPGGLRTGKIGAPNKHGLAF